MYRKILILGLITLFTPVVADDVTLVDTRERVTHTLNDKMIVFDKKGNPTASWGNDRDIVIMNKDNFSGTGKYSPHENLCLIKDIVTGEEVFVSRSALNNHIKDKIYTSIKVVDIKTGKEFEVPKQKGVVKLSEVSRSNDESGKTWSYYDVSIVDDNGGCLTALDDKIFVRNPKNCPTYRVAKQAYDQATLFNSIKEFEEIQRLLKAIVQGLKSEKSCEGSTTTTTVLTSSESDIFAEKKSSNVTETKSLDRHTYINYMKNRKEILLDAENSCVKRPKNQKFYECRIEKCNESLKKLRASLGPEIWGNDSKEIRASKILNQAKTTIGKLREASVASNFDNKRSSSNAYLDMMGGKVFEKEITPELLACISYRETKINLSPHDINYTYCNQGPLKSTAIGLGQVTRNLFMALRDHEGRNLLPMTTVSLDDKERYAKMSDLEIFHEMADNVDLQMEVIARSLNYKFQFKKMEHYKRGHLLQGDGLIKTGVAYYDQDNQTKYVRDVVGCLKCFNDGKSPYTCYEKVGPSK